MKKVAIILATACSNLLNASSCSSQAQPNPPNDSDYDYYYDYGPEYYFEDNASDVYWFGPGWYWGVFFFNEDNYWDYHHQHHNHWHAKEHRGQRSWNNNTGARRDLRRGGQNQQRIQQSQPQKQTRQDTKQSQPQKQTQQSTKQAQPQKQTRQDTKQSQPQKQAQPSIQKSQPRQATQQSTKQPGSGTRDEKKDKDKKTK